MGQYILTHFSEKVLAPDSLQISVDHWIKTKARGKLGNVLNISPTKIMDVEIVSLSGPSIEAVIEKLTSSFAVKKPG